MAGFLRARQVRSFSDAQQNFDQLEQVMPLIGVGSPEGVVAAAPGRLYTNRNGGAGTTLYVKETGTGKTGWVGK